MNEQTRELFSFINASPTAFHVVDNIKKMLINEGYSELFEHQPWHLLEGGKYFVIKNGSSIVAFKVPFKDKKSFSIVATHCDSPTFKLKTNADKKGGGDLGVISTECYGGAILNSWFDRPLSVAGRAIVCEDGQFSSRLFNIDRDFCIIPNVAIHFNREINNGFKIMPNVDTLPLYSMGEGSIEDEIKKAVDCDEILSTDSYLYLRQQGVEFGLNDEFIGAPKLDDLMCVFSSLKAFLYADESASIPVLAVFDNEEVGSETKQGAASTFFKDTLKKAAVSLNLDDGVLSQSFMVSADNAHAIHPNHPEYSDLQNAPKLNGGVVIKHNANQRYATDAVSAGVFKGICKKAGVPVQDYHNRADLPGGSTLGSIADTMLPVMTVDIGLPQLAMHSAFETAGAKDLSFLIDALTAFYSSTFYKNANDVVVE